MNDLKNRGKKKLPINIINNNKIYFAKSNCVASKISVIRMHAFLILFLRNLNLYFPYINSFSVAIMADCLVCLKT